MRIDCIAILASLMQHCPEGLSYEAIEALQHVRPTNPSTMRGISKSVPSPLLSSCSPPHNMQEKIVVSISRFISTSMSMLLVQARVFLHYPIRPSVVYELLDLTNIQYFRRTLVRFFFSSLIPFSPLSSSMPSLCHSGLGFRV